jgi:hypothetical protein
MVLKCFRFIAAYSNNATVPLDLLQDIFKERILSRALHTPNLPCLLF